jgi:hypothetical protein
MLMLFLSAYSGSSCSGCPFSCCSSGFRVGAGALNVRRPPPCSDHRFSGCCPGVSSPAGVSAAVGRDFPDRALGRSSRAGASAAPRRSDCRASSFGVWRPPARVATPAVKITPFGAESARGPGSARRGFPADPAMYAARSRAAYPPASGRSSAGASSPDRLPSAACWHPAYRGSRSVYDLAPWRGARSAGVAGYLPPTASCPCVHSDLCAAAVRHPLPS